MKHVTIGIDPGATGGVSWVASDGTCGAHTVDTKDIQAVLAALDTVPRAEKTAAAIEQVWGRGGWNAASTFGLGGAFWVAKAALTLRGYDFVEVVPRDWQAPVWEKHGPNPGEYDQRKAALIEVAHRLYPGYKFKSGEADSILLARFYANKVFRYRFL